MELNHLLQLVSELPQNTTLNYVRSEDQCKFVSVDIEGERIFSVAPNGEDKSWTPSYLSDLAPKILENEPFNLSGLLNNKGSYRPVLETIIAHTREFYTVRKGTATALVWIPTKLKSALELEEILSEDIPAPLPQMSEVPTLSKEKLAEELEHGFIAYFTNYLRLSTGKSDSSKIDFYLSLYKKQIEKPITEKFQDFTSIFGFSDVASLNNFILRVSKELPNMGILLEDKWPQEKDKQTIYYEPWTMVRHYKSFLELLKVLNRVSLSINPSIRPLDFLSQRKVSSYSRYLAAMRTKPFLLLAGISGTGKSRIVKEMAFASCPPSLRNEKEVSPGNYCMIEVKPNWHDSTELIGYVSRIGGEHYVITPFINFLIKAWHNPKAPFFVCLDEMNLAPVEQYFAEFLSVLESRKLNNGEIVSEPLVKAEYTSKYINDFEAAYSGKKHSEGYGAVTSTSDPAVTYGTDIFADIAENGLRLPPNVIVIGTVNMDETTYQFSRKVIDRAMTIEMNEVDFDAMFTKDTDTLKYANPYMGAEFFVPKYTAAKEALEVISEEDRDLLQAQLPVLLKQLDATLRTTPFRVAYRVQNESILYFVALREEQPDADASQLLTSAMDDILMMKVLPRIEGNEDTLEQPLKLLADFTAEKYLHASEKINEMQERLKANHFTSFWP